jgi:hypothetical protein
MKALRLLTIIVVVVLVISIWVPAPVYATPSGSDSTVSVHMTVNPAKTKLSKLTVDNRTGGTLFVSMSGPRNYFFSTAKRGKTTFSNIEPGKYTIVLRTSACGGSLTYTKNLKKGGGANIKPVVCR